MLQLASSTSSSSDASSAVLGSTEPRLWTRPLRELTPETSYGFDLIDFARDVVGIPFDPWQEWLSIHVGELLPDGRPRFRTVLILIARQNGKTTWAKILVLYWLFVELVPLVLNTSTDRSYAKRFWSDICDMARDNPEFAAHLGPGSIRLTISEESLKTLDGAEATFRANNGRAGRSMTLFKWLCDEVREHHSRDCWDSASKAMNAVRDAQAVAISNQGDDSAVVLDSLRGPALEFIETGRGDPRLGLFEWSAPDGADPTDPPALAAANPNVGRRLDMADLLADAQRAVRAGGKELAAFCTEVLCQRARRLNPAIDPGAWKRCASPGDLSGVRDRVAACLDVAPDQQHATLYAAAQLPGGKTRVDVVKDWSGVGCTAAMAADLPALLARVRPRVLGWFPGGPAASAAADLDANRKGWLPAGTSVQEIGADLPAVCMGFESQVTAHRIAHSDDPLLNAQVGGAQPLKRGDRWVFSRMGEGHCDALYSAAGAVHLARTMPAPVGKPRLIVAK